MFTLTHVGQPKTSVILNGGIVLNAPADTTTVTKLNDVILGAKDAGLITISSTITDNSTGTSGGDTIAAVTDVATAANAIATLAENLNTLSDSNYL